MRICAIVKYPPIEGGVSAQTYWMCRALAARGHEVFVVTNADEVEPEYRAWLCADDRERLQIQIPGSGSVKVRSSHAWDGQQYAHVPAGNPAAAKLAAMATEMVREHDCDLILAFYLEPYGIAANLASAWTGCPFVVRHSGSDRYRLMGHPDLGLAYKEVLRAATAVLTSGTDLAGFGIPEERRIPAPGSYIPAEFSPTAAPLELNALIAQVTADRPGSVLNPAELNGSPVLGVYGKFAAQKGTLDLLRAVAALRRRGIALQLVMLGGGTRWPSVEATIGDCGIGDVTWRLPYVAPWRVPGFIRACDAVCFLEHGFEISAHQPGVAAEVMTCGAPLIVSGEIAAKQPCALTDGKDCYLVPDPADHDALAAVIARAIADKGESRRVGLAAATLMAGPEEDEVGAGYEKALTDCLELASRDSARPSRRSRAAGRDSSADGLFRAKLEEFVRTRCPATVTLAAGRLPGLLDEAATAARTRPTSTLAAAYHMSAELADSLDQSAAQQPLGQFSRIERNLLWFRFDDEGQRGIATYPVPVLTDQHLPADDASLAQLRPVASRLIRFERLSVDAAAYASAARTGVLPSYQLLPWHTALFCKVAQLGGTVHRIDRRTEELIGWCTGESSIDAILAGLGVAGPSRGTVLRLIEAMLRSRLLALAAAPAVNPCDERSTPLVLNAVKAE